MPSNSNSINPKTLTHSPSPIYGIPYGFNISDLPSVGLAQPIPTLAAVSTATVSAELNIQARSIEIDVAFSAPLATCQIDVYSAADGYTQSLFTATASQVEKPATGTNLDPLPPDNTDNLLPSTTIFVGNFENINLNGAPVKIKVSNVSAGTVTVAYRLTS